MEDIFVKKSDGQVEKFDISKIESSLRLSGVAEDDIREIISEIKAMIRDKISTDEIFIYIKDKLKEHHNSINRKAFLRYNLPNAIAKLGPEGFAFEKFISEVFLAYGYSSVMVGKKIKGRCMVHELDVLAEKGDIKMTAELKFHNSRSKKTDLKVVLYMKARFDDILESGYYGNKQPRQVIITNTKFTDNAKIYAKCAGVEVIS